MTINTDKKFIQIAIPRTASTCISDALKTRNHPEPFEHHCTIEEALDKHPEAKDFYKFTFVRNPFDKLVSIYYEFRKNRKCQYSGEKFMDRELLSEFDVSASDTENFRNFCGNLQASSWAEDLFFKPQLEYISINGVDVMDYIGRFENLGEGWSHIRAEIGMADVSLNVSPQEPRGFLRGSDHPPYQEMYTEKEKEIVENLYKKDLEYLNYSF